MSWVSQTSSAESWSTPDDTVEQWYPYSPRITVSGKNLLRDGAEFKVWGVQPIHHQWIKDYFRTGGEAERAEIVAQTRGAKAYKANTIRTHLDLWDFIAGSSLTDLSMQPTALSNFLYMLEAARKEQMYLLVSANNAWEPSIIPAWYDALTYEQRWEVQAFFFTELCKAVYEAGFSTTVLGYELASEPTIVSAADGDWYSGLLGDWYFSPRIARGVPDEDHPRVVREWITRLSSAIDNNDPGALITIGLFSEHHGTAAFGPPNIDDLLDFLSPHMYPSSDVPDDIAGMTEWASGSTPVVHGETLMWSTDDNNAAFMDGVIPLVQGMITFYYGYPPEEFTFAPDPPKPQAEDNNTIGYAIQYLSMITMGVYRDTFLPQAATWQQ